MVFGEWTCNICRYQTYGEKRIRKHIEEKHEKPLHTCGKSEEFCQDPTDLNNNCFESMETDSVDSNADTESLGIQEAIDPMHDQGLASLEYAIEGTINQREEDLQAKKVPIEQRLSQRQQSFHNNQQNSPYKYRRFYNGFRGRRRGGFRGRNGGMNRWTPRWGQGRRRGRYQKPKISKEELDAQSNSYMANTDTVQDKVFEEFRKTTLKFKAKFAESY